MASRRTSTRKEAGFTLMEVLIVIALFVIIASLGLLMSFDTYRSNNYLTEQNQLLSLLQKARSQAVNNINQKPHGIYINFIPAVPKYEYTLFQGADYANRDVALDQVYETRLSVGGMITEMTFSQLTGKPSIIGNITLDDHVHPVFNICINSEGQINAKPTCS